jgi:hypothetical protein
MIGVLHVNPKTDIVIHCTDCTVQYNL